MNGHVHKRGPATAGGPPRKRPWAFVLEVGQHATGKRNQVLRSGFATKRDAQAALQEEIQRRASGMVLDAKRLSVGEFVLQRWYPGLSSLRPSTLRSYEYTLRIHIVPRLGGRPLRDLSTPDVNEFLATLTRPVDAGGAALSASTVRIVYSTLRSALADAVRWGLIPSNVAVGAQLPRRNRPEMKVWSAGELRNFLLKSADDELGPLYALIATTGLRRGEATGLRWSRVDLDQARLLIDHQLIDHGYKTVSSGEPKSQRGRRVIAIDKGTVELLRRQADRQKQQRVAAGLTGDATYVFTRADGEPHHPDFVTSHFNVLARQTKSPVIRLHDLRHTHATLGLAAGIPAKVMADRLGHSSVLLTLDTYSHVSPTVDAGAAELIAGLIAGVEEETQCDPEVIHEDPDAPEGA